MTQVIHGIGTDILQIDRMTEKIVRNGDSFLKRVFSESERAEAALLSDERRKNFWAKHFVVKEAFSKALGTGIGKTVHLRDVVLTHDAFGAPGLKLLSPTKEAVLSHLQCTEDELSLFVSLSDDSFAVAFVMIALNRN